MFFRTAFLITLASMVSFASVACSSTTTGTGTYANTGDDGGKTSTDDDDDKTPSTGTKSDAGTKPSTGTQGSSCQEILECALACEDEACEEACYAKGSSSGQQQVDALISCSSENGCSDSTCLEENCAAEISGCN